MPSMLPDILGLIKNSTDDPSGLLKRMLTRLAVSHRTYNFGSLYHSLRSVPEHIWKQYSRKYSQNQSAEDYYTPSNMDDSDIRSNLTHILSEMGIGIRPKVGSAKLVADVSALFDAYSALEILDEVGSSASKRDQIIISEMRSEHYEKIRRLYSTTFI